MSLEDRTEEATPRRRQEARDEGQVARSMEVNAAAVLISGLLILKATGGKIGASLQEVMVQSLGSFPKHDIAPTDVRASAVQLSVKIGLAIAPLVFGVMVVGVISNVAQVGLRFSPKVFQIKGARLNPFQGIVGMFSARACVELGKALAKISVIGVVIYSYLRDKAPEIAGLVGANYTITCKTIGEITYQLFLRTALVLLVIAAIDYIYQRKQHEKQIKMTKQEVKEDTKRSEGDPQVKGKIRAKQREIAQRRMMAEVPKADVVVTNPTHFAVALKYDSAKSDAPQVVAKGMDYLAQKIKAIAQENNVPLVENVQLARTLYATVEVGDEIPSDLYQAVAEILAYVYKLKNKLRA